MNNIRKFLWIILLIAIIIGILVIGINVNKKTKQNTGKIQVVVSNFASYDFVRAIVGDSENVELTFLLGPGKDAHSYDPTAQDLTTIQNADLFVYIGGEMENWSGKVLETLDTSNTKVVCIADYVDKLGEEEVDGAEKEEEEEEEGAFDEHIWTSPRNAISMVNILEKAMEEVDSTNSRKYKENAENYISQIQEVDEQIQGILDNKVRNRLVFGDKMPMQYFISYYDLDVSAAFNGCSTETDPSSKTIAYLVNIVKNEQIPVVLYTELSNGVVAQTIASEVQNGCQAMQIQTLHNVTKTDFDNGETWVSLMKRNIETLKIALQ